MNLPDLILSANHNLFRNKTRTILTILAIFVGSFAIITTTAIQTGVNNFIDSQVDSFGGEGFIQMYAKNQDGPSSQPDSAILAGQPKEYNSKVGENGLYAITAEQIEKVKTTEGIKEGSVLVGHFGSATFAESTKNSKQFEVTTNIMTNGSVHYDLIAGRMIDNHSKNYELMLPSEDWARALGYDNAEAAIDQTLRLAVLDQFTHENIYFDAKIVGVQAPSVITGSSLIINEPLNDALYAENTKYATEEQKTAVYTLAAEYEYEHYSAEDIKARLSDLGLEATTVKDITGEIKTFFDVIITVFKIFGYIALIAAAIGIVNTLYMSVQERTREIGLMKSFGLSNTSIFFSFALEAILLGFWGSALGTLISMSVVGAFDSVAHVNDGFLQAFPTFHLGEFTIETIIPPIVTVMIIAFIVSVLPALKAARKNPIDSLRYE